MESMGSGRARIGDGWAKDEISRQARRPMAVLAILGYPVAVTALTQGQPLGLPAGVAVGIFLALIAVTLWSMYRLYEFRGRLAQRPDADLDERQRAIRDRAYLESFRVFVGLVLLGLLALIIVPDVLNKALTLDGTTLNWWMMGVILISTVLPSAVVAWREPDLPDED